MITHYIEAYATRGPGNSEMAICGEFVTRHRHAAEPTCPHCLAIIAEEEAQIEALKAMPTDPALLVKHEAFDPLKGYKPRGVR